MIAVARSLPLSVLIVAVVSGWCGYVIRGHMDRSRP